MKSAIAKLIKFSLLVAFLLPLAFSWACGSEATTTPPSTTPESTPATESPTSMPATESPEKPSSQNGQENVITESPEKPSSQDGQENIIVDSQEKNIIIDTFQQGEYNLLGGNSTLFNTENAWANREIVSDLERVSEHDEEGQVLQLSYNVSEKDTYAGYVTSLNGLNLSNYQTLSFFVKGAEGKEIVLIGLKNGVDTENKVRVGDYLLTDITTSWQEVLIPLVTFFTIEERQSMQNLSFSFEYGIGSDQGMIYVDDIQCLPGIDNILIDRFDSLQGYNLLGGGMRILLEGNCNIDADYDSQNSVDKSPCGYRISYGGSIGDLQSYCGWASDLKDIDASEIDAIIFSIKGGMGGEQPNIYLDDGTNRAYVDIEDYVLITDSWQKVSIPLLEFSSQGVDLSHLKEFQIVFEWEQMSGTIYIDNLAFSSS